MYEFSRSCYAVGIMGFVLLKCKFETSVGST